MAIIVGGYYWPVQRLDGIKATQFLYYVNTTCLFGESKSWQCMAGFHTGFFKRGGGGGGEPSGTPHLPGNSAYSITNILTARIHLWKNSRCF